MNPQIEKILQNPEFNAKIYKTANDEEIKSLFEKQNYKISKDEIIEVKKIFEACRKNIPTEKLTEEELLNISGGLNWKQSLAIGLGTTAAIIAGAIITFKIAIPEKFKEEIIFGINKIKVEASINQIEESMKYIEDHHHLWKNNETENNWVSNTFEKLRTILEE